MPISSTLAPGSINADDADESHRRVAPAEVAPPGLSELRRRGAVLVDRGRVDDERDEVVGLGAGGAHGLHDPPGGRVELLDERLALPDLAPEVDRPVGDHGVGEADRLGQVGRVDDHRPVHAGLLPSDQAA